MIRQFPSHASAAAPSRLLLASTYTHQPSPFFFTTARLLSTETTTPSATQALSTPPPSLTRAHPASQPVAPTARAASPAPKPRQLTYLVERTASNHIAVYENKRSGGTRKETVIRKIVGNPLDLKRDIIVELKFKTDNVTINPVTGHLKIKGYHKKKVEAWLAARGL